MGSGPSHFVGCFIRPRDGSSDGAMGVQFSEPLDEGLGHSFCYVRPPPVGSPPLLTPDKSEEFAPFYNGGKYGPATVGNDETYVDAADLLSASKEEKENAQSHISRSSSADRPRPSSEKAKNATNEKVKIVSETSFKSISGASVSANTATPRSIISCEQFNSFSNVLYGRAAAFESTSSFSAIPLQPVPRAFSGPMSGPLDRADRGFMSGPLERERGFMSGPLERGFMSGPLERGFMSGPLDTSLDRTHFSAPLNGSYHDRGYFRKSKKSLVRFMRSVSRPMKKAFARTVSSMARTHQSIVTPVKTYMLSRESSHESNDRVGDSEKRESGPRKGVDPVDPSVEFSSSELDVRESDNLQWAQGKAGEDRVHVVISEEHGWVFVGIYDGFNGPDAPDFLMSNLYPAVFQELKGLLWTPKVEECSVPVEDAEEIEESGEQEIGNDRLADGGEQAYVKKMNRWRSKRARGDMILVEERQQGSFGVIDVGQNWSGNRKEQGRNGEKACTEIEWGSEEDIPRLSLDESRDGMHDVVDDAQVSRGACSEPGALQRWGDPPPYLAGTHGKFGQGEAKSNVNLAGVRRNERFATEREAKLAEDWGDGQVDELENERSSDQPEFDEASAVFDQDTKRKKRAAPAIKPRHDRDRRKEQLYKYFQWRYDWDQEKSGGMLQKAKNAKVAQDPDSSGEGEAVEHAFVLKALARALENTENAYLDMADTVLYENPELALMGSCVLVMLMKDKDMYIMNVGDSRAIIAQHPRVEPLNTVPGKGSWNGLPGNDSGARDSLLRLELERIIEETPMELEALEAVHENGSVGAPLLLSEPSLLGALQLTIDHSTNIKEEVLRLKAEHPDDDIIENDRVKGKLKVTRAFGAGFLKQPKWNNALLEMFQINFIGTAPYISCSPALYHHMLGPQDEFLVLSSDGLYQYLSNEEVVSHVEWFMKKFPDGDPAQHLIEELLFRAAKKAGMEFHDLLDIPQGDRRKYHDDVSVMVISLEGRIWRSSG